MGKIVEWWFLKPREIHVWSSSDTPINIYSQWDRRNYTKEPTRFVRDGDGWCVAEPSQLEVWRDYYIDKSAAQQALRESKYDEFILWMKTREALDSAKFEGEWSGRSAVELLLDRPASWAELAYGIRNFAYSYSVKSFRKEIYQHYDCIRVTEREWIHVSEWSSVLKRERRWG